MKTVTIEGLAEILGISVKTIYNRRNNNPASLPLPLLIPGQKFWSGWPRTWTSGCSGSAPA